MFQLLKKLLIFLFLCLCCFPQVGCHDVIHVNGTAGRNLTVEFTVDGTIKTDGQVNMYQNSQKIHTFHLSNKSCFSCVNHTMSTICIKNMTQKTISLSFTHLTHSAVYFIAVLKQGTDIEESNRVNLTVHPAEYTTTYTTATSVNITPLHQDQSGNKSTLLTAVLVLFVLVLVALFGLLYWNCRKKTDKPPAVNPTSAPQVISVPDVTCVEYCVLDFPNRPGEKVRSTEERVEYSPIVFPLRKTLAQENGGKSTTQQNKIKKSPKLQHEENDSDKVSEKAKTAKPRHPKCPKKSHLTPSSHVPKAQV
ncbi:hypothetical protein KOW79_009017 [Hemibagrus wyckioides]|uniref:Uncharacterized protein n=1 Tax=Hemibagrus wyckioides TaxID=337641 RepID=A0A9D3SK22_9TELE|nr:uncharacterized protein LOC131360247 [Hemibagrus wyckioides]KAG7327411.1 hypothetical protein KOW79_009017 [Hemibagrus wyckioides]